MKKWFLVTYEYGMGAVWAWLCAGSKEQIEREFPELTVHTNPPEWMQKEASTISERMTLDIDETDTGFLAVLLEQRRSR